MFPISELFVQSEIDRRLEGYRAQRGHELTRTPRRRLRRFSRR